MRMNYDGATVRAMDVLFLVLAKLLAVLKEKRLDVLKQRMKDMDIPEQSYGGILIPESLVHSS